MKTVVAILFSWLLAFPASALTTTMKACPRCACAACNTTQCCAREKAPASQPAAPVRTTNSESQAWLASVMIALLDFPATTPRVTISAVSPADCSAHVPLYQWNCSYLL